jgi:hypothetical protein
MIAVQKVVAKTVREKRLSIEDKIKVLDMKIIDLDEELMTKYEEYRDEKISREGYLDSKMEIEVKVLNMREKIQSLENLLFNGVELQIEDVTGLEVLGRYLKVDRLTRELVDVVVEKVVVRKRKEVEVKLKMGVKIK